MGLETKHVYRFGDLLAIARASWVRRMERELELRGYPGYRRSDAATMRRLLRGPAAIGALGAALGVTRQAARKAVAGLERRGYATTGPDPGDARKVKVHLTERGRAYAQAVVEAVELANREVAERVRHDQLVAADAALRAVVHDEQLRRLADRVPAPRGGIARGDGTARASGA